MALSNFNPRFVDNLKHQAKMKMGTGNREIVCKDDFLRAQANVYNMQIGNMEDAFLFFASLNVLRQYSKQIQEHDRKNGTKSPEAAHNFNGYANDGIDMVITNQVKLVTFCVCKVRKLLIINVNGVQFAYPKTHLSPKMYYQAILRNQYGVNAIYHKQDYCSQEFPFPHAATTVFNQASSLSGLTNRSVHGEPLSKTQERNIQLGRLGKTYVEKRAALEAKCLKQKIY